MRSFMNLPPPTRSDRALTYSNNISIERFRRQKNLFNVRECECINKKSFYIITVIFLLKSTIVFAKRLDTVMYVNECCL